MPKFVTRKWIKVNDLLNGQYYIKKNIKFETPMLRSNAYTVVKGRISVTSTDDNNIINKKLTVKNDAPFRSSRSKFSNIFTDNPEDLDIVMLMYLLEYIHILYSYIFIYIMLR